MSNRTSLYLPSTPKMILVIGFSIALLLRLLSLTAYAATIAVAEPGGSGNGQFSWLLENWIC